MFIQVSDETSLSLFAGVNSEYKGLMISDFDVSEWHMYADVLNVVKLRDDMVEQHVAFKGHMAFFGLQHVQAVYHRNGLGLYKTHLEQTAENKANFEMQKSSRRGRRQKTTSCSSCGH